MIKIDNFIIKFTIIFLVTFNILSDLTCQKNLIFDSGNRVTADLVIGKLNFLLAENSGTKKEGTILNLKDTIEIPKNTGKDNLDPQSKSMNYNLRFKYLDEFLTEQTEYENTAPKKKTVSLQHIWLLEHALKLDSRIGHHFFGCSR